MIEKLMSIVETIGAILIVAAFTLWSSEYWKLSNVLFWCSIALFTPVIIWKARNKHWTNWIITIIAYCALLLIGSWWFGNRVIKAHIPGLPEITIQR